MTLYSFFTPVPAVLAQLVFPSKTRSGMRVQATCLVQEGDQPFSFMWKKDGNQLRTGNDFRISQLDVFTSILVIEKASADHSGNYTCEVTNPATTSVTSSALNVRGDYT